MSSWVKLLTPASLSRGQWATGWPGALQSWTWNAQVMIGCAEGESGSSMQE